MKQGPLYTIKGTLRPDGKKRINLLVYFSLKFVLQSTKDPFFTIAYKKFIDFRYWYKSG